MNQNDTLREQIADQMFTAREHEQGAEDTARFRAAYGEYLADPEVLAATLRHDQALRDAGYRADFLRFHTALSTACRQLGLPAPSIS
jgi:hypothetical protein